MGQKQGKHRRDGDEEEDPSVRRSPKRSSKRGSKASKTPSRESTPPNIEALEKEPRAGPKTREIVIESKKTAEPEMVPKSGSPKKSPTKKSPSKGVKKKAKVVHEEVISKSETSGVESGRAGPQTPKKQTGQEVEPVTPMVNDMSITNHNPQATSTPAAPNGVISTGITFNSPLHSPGSTDHSGSEDEEEDEYTPTDQQHDSSMERRSDVNFGRFYTASYLENGKAEYLKRASLNPQENQKSPHYHRPLEPGTYKANFSYSSEKPDFLKPRKVSSSGSGMMALAQGGTRVVKVRRSSSPSALRNSEAVRMSTFPGGKPPPPNEIEKIERDDWPGPASPAAILPEILRERRRSRGEKDDDDEEEIPEDPKIQRELNEISKLKDKSGIGSVIYKELEERKALPKKPMDPWLSSRVPSAKYVPRYGTRFQSPMFASPSRFLDRPRYAWDDSEIRGYRSLSGIGYNYSQTPKPGYGPSYGIAPRAATLPLTGLYGARDDFEFLHVDRDQPEQNGDRRGRSTHTSSSTMNADSLPKREPRVWGISGVSGYDGPSISLLKLQKSTWHTEAEPPIYPYEKLKITNFDLPKDVDTNHLEIHLNEDDFQSIFEMPKDKFYRLAEWKRNDIKRKHHLY